MYEVAKLPVGARGVNYTLRAVDGASRGIRARAERLVDASTPLPTTPRGALVTPPAVDYLPGMLVTYRSKGVDPTEPFVILRTSDGGLKASLVRIGGDGGQYYRGVSTRFLTLIDPPA